METTYGNRIHRCSKGIERPRLSHRLALAFLCRHVLCAFCSLSSLHRDDQVKAALAAEPGSNLHAYQLPLTPTSPAEILVGQGLKEFRVYVNPRTLEVLKIYDEDQRLDHFTLRLHGEMLIGNTGSYIVELAASWTVVMILTGLYLWWPRTSERFAGVFYPRLKQGQRIFWRDIHAVTGVYVSFFALFLLFSGLPWAKSWGSYLKLARRVGGRALISTDWTTSSAEEKAIPRRTSFAHPITTIQMLDPA